MGSRPTGVWLYDFLHPAWGGTDYLEDHDLAHAKYRDRLFRWSASPAFVAWDVAERDRALADADYIHSSTGTAAEYWAAVPGYWETTYPPLFVSLDPAQYVKIVAAVGASSSAAAEYEKQRDLSTHIDFEFPESLKPPWWAWAAGGVVVLLALRR
jgi:hypothetical protein